MWGHMRLKQQSTGLDTHEAETTGLDTHEAETTGLETHEAETTGLGNPDPPDYTGAYNL